MSLLKIANQTSNLLTRLMRCDRDCSYSEGAACCSAWWCYHTAASPVSACRVLVAFWHWGQCLVLLMGMGFGGWEGKLGLELTKHKCKHFLVSSSLRFHFWNLSGERKRCVRLWDRPRVLIVCLREGQWLAQGTSYGRFSGLCAADEVCHVHWATGSASYSAMNPQVSHL